MQQVAQSIAQDLMGHDPAVFQILPFPVEFKMFGADANQLAPRDLLDQGMETLLNDTHVHQRASYSLCTNSDILFTPG